MIKYTILIWEEDDMSDIIVLYNSYNNKARVFDDQETAEMHAKTRTRNCSYRVVEVPVPILE